MTGKKNMPLQVYLREDQLRGLRVIAKRQGKSMSALVRQGVDLLLDELPVDKNPLLDIVGMYDSGLGDLAEEHNQYLSQIVSGESVCES